MIGTRWGFYLGVPFAILILIAGLTPTAFGLGAQGEIGFLAYAAKSPFYSLSVLTSLGALVGVFVGFFADLIRRVFALPMRLAGLGHTTHLQPVPAPNEFVISETDLLDSTFLPPVRKRRPWFWILAVGLPAAASIPILAIAIGAGIYARKSTDQRLARAMAAADRDDPNWRIDALMARRKVVPDRENSAIRIARVNAMLPRAWHGTPPNPAG